MNSVPLSLLSREFIHFSFRIYYYDQQIILSFFLFLYSARRYPCDLWRTVYEQSNKSIDPTVREFIEKDGRLKIGILFKLCFFLL